MHALLLELDLNGMCRAFVAMLLGNCTLQVEIYDMDNK